MSLSSCIYRCLLGQLYFEIIARLRSLWVRDRTFRRPEHPELTGKAGCDSSPRSPSSRCLSPNRLDVNCCHEICQDCLLDRWRLGCAGLYAALFHVQHDRKSGSSANHTSRLLLRICRSRFCLADYLLDYRGRSHALSSNYSRSCCREVHLRSSNDRALLSWSACIPPTWCLQEPVCSLESCLSLRSSDCELRPQDSIYQ